MDNNSSIDKRSESVERQTEGMRAFYFRHSQALYNSYAQKVASDNPRGPVDIENQPMDDLTPEGHKLAHVQAEKFFTHLDHDRDVLFIVSSDQTRTLQTADIYAKAALERGFTVIQHDNTGTDIAKKIGGGYVRSLETMSLNYGDALQDLIFNSESHMPKNINWAAAGDEYKAQWEMARQIILKDDRGSWGANFFAHADALKKILHGIHTPQELYDRQYKNLLRLADFGKKKVGNQRINVLAFGHENMMGIPLAEDTGDHALPNCEGVELKNGKLERVVL